MNLGGCEAGECEAVASITYLGHGVCEGHWNQLTAEEASPDALRSALGIEAPTILPMEEAMTVPKAGARRGKRSEDSKAKEKAPKESKPKKDKDGRDDSQVVFAFRLGQSDRDRIHQAAGPGKATRFVRAAALAAATADTKAFEQLVAQAKANLK